MSSAFASLSRLLDAAMPAFSSADRYGAIRERFFFLSHFAAGLIALGAFPLLLLFSGPPTAIEAATLAFLAAPLLVAVFQWRTGRLEIAHLLSAATISCAVVWGAAFTAGLASPTLVWLAIVPVGAALSGSRRVSLAGIGIALVALLALLLGTLTGLLPEGAALPAWASLIVVLGAVLYGAALASVVGVVQQRAERDAARDAARYRLLAEHATDLITCHAADGSLLSATPAARALLGVPAARLVGQGLLARVHVADKPAFLTALSRAAGDKARSEIEIRLRRSAGPGEAEIFFPAEMRCAPAPDAAGLGASVIAIIRDASERKEREFALQNARVVAAEAKQALAAIGRRLHEKGIAAAAEPHPAAAPPFAETRSGYDRTGIGSGHSVVAGLAALKGGLPAAKSGPGEAAQPIGAPAADGKDTDRMDEKKRA